MTKNILDADIFNIKINDSVYLEFDIPPEQSENIRKCTDFIINDADEKNVTMRKSPVCLNMEDGGTTTYRSWLCFLVAGTYTIQVICPKKPKFKTKQLLCFGEKYMKTIAVV